MIGMHISLGNSSPSPELSEEREGSAYHQQIFIKFNDLSSHVAPFTHVIIFDVIFLSCLKLPQK